MAKVYEKSTKNLNVGLETFRLKCDILKSSSLTNIKSGSHITEDRMRYRRRIERKDMLGKTHMAVGVAASLLLLQPHTLAELILGAGTAAVGSVISDIDCGTSESSRRADQIIFVLETIVIGIVVVEAHWHLGLYQRLMSNSSVSRIVLACAAFLAICAYGKKTPHRSFFHSFLAGGLLMSSVGVFLPILVPYFGIAFASHLVLDFLNHKGEQLLYPYRKRFSLGICSASGLVNRLFLFCGSVLSVGVTLKLLTGVIFHR